MLRSANENGGCSGEPRTRCEADRSAGPRRRRRSSPCVSCPKVPVDKHTSEGPSSLLAGSLPPWIPACTETTNTHGRVRAQAGRTNLRSDLLLGQGGHEFAADVRDAGDHAAPYQARDNREASEYVPEEPSRVVPVGSALPSGVLMGVIREGGRRGVPPDGRRLLAPRRLSRL
jgi:hypothetical protein